MVRSVASSLRSLILALAIAVWAAPATADINLELRPLAPTAAVGQTVEAGLYAVSDSDLDQLFSAMDVILGWTPESLQFLGIDSTGAVPLNDLSGIPAGDPFNLNEVVPPQDGDALYQALAPLSNSVAATPAGTLLTTFQFTAVASTPGTVIDILASGGGPMVGHTTVFDGTTPGTDVTGTLSGTSVEVVPEPPALALLLVAGSVMWRRMRRGPA